LALPGKCSRFPFKAGGATLQLAITGQGTQQREGIRT
jgi:hypothetical protein